MSSALDRLTNLTNKISYYETVRKENLKILKNLYKKIEIDKKVESFSDLFDFKAINLSGASLLSDSLGEIKKGKYLQVLAISYDKNATQKSKNVSLAYFGKVENVDSSLNDMVVEFINRYRFAKSFMTFEKYYESKRNFKVNA